MTAVRREILLDVRVHLACIRHEAARAFEARPSLPRALGADNAHFLAHGTFCRLCTCAPGSGLGSRKA